VNSPFAIAAEPFVRILQQQHGCALVEHQTPISFDNERIELESATLKIDLYRERGQDCFSVSAAQGPRRMFDAQLLGTLLRDTALVKESERPEADVARLAPRLIANLPALIELFAPGRREETERELARLADARAEALFGIRPKPA
jgi:hypothetical protein